MTAHVTAVIPTYNVRDYVAAAVRSALEQTYRDLDVVVVDDGSTDGTVELIEQEFGSSCTLIRRQHGGPSAARNAAVAATTGELITFLDGDDLWLPEKIDKQVALLSADRAIGFCYTDWLPITAAGEPVRSRAASNGPAGDLPSAEIVFWNPIHTSSAMIRRDVFDAAGGFREALWTGEDVDLWLRVSFRHRIVRVPETLVKVRTRPGQTRWVVKPVSGVVNALRSLPDIEPDLNDELRTLLRTGVAYHALRKARELAAAGDFGGAARFLGIVAASGPAAITAARYTLADPASRPWAH